MAHADGSEKLLISFNTQKIFLINDKFEPQTRNKSTQCYQLIAESFKYTHNLVVTSESLIIAK